MRTEYEIPEEGIVDSTVNIPAEIARQSGRDAKQIARHLLEQTAVEGYRTGEISRGQVAQLLRMDWVETEEFLAQRHCDRHYDLEDLETDRQNLDKLLGPE